MIYLCSCATCLLLFFRFPQACCASDHLRFFLYESKKALVPLLGFFAFGVHGVLLFVVTDRKGGK
jgi:hypothetical protein